MPAYLPEVGELVRVLTVWPGSGDLAQSSEGRVMRVTLGLRVPYRCDGEDPHGELWPKEVPEGEWVLVFFQADRALGTNAVCQVAPLTADEEAVWRLSGK